MSEPESAGLRQRPSPDTSEGSREQPLASGDHGVLAQDGIEEGDGRPPEPPTPLPGYEHV